MRLVVLCGYRGSQYYMLYLTQFGTVVSGFCKLEQLSKLLTLASYNKILSRCQIYAGLNVSWGANLISILKICDSTSQ